MSLRLAHLALALGVLAGCGEHLASIPDAAPQTDAAPAQPCGATLTPVAQQWVLLFDRTATWSTRLDRYDGLKDGLATFLHRHPALPIGAVDVPRFPGGDEAAAEACDVEAYRSLTPGPTDPPPALEDTMRAWAPRGASTLAPALRGAGATASADQLRGARASSLIVLTDAAAGEETGDCGADWDDVIAAAAATFADGTASSVPVHVLSVAGSAQSPDHGPRIADLAAAGGGYGAVVWGSRSDIASSAATVLDDIEARGVCRLAVPTGLSPEEVAAIVSPDGSVTTARRVGSAGGCAPDGFFVDDLERPTTVTLCSGHAGVGGLCEVTFLRARAAGAPTIVVTAPATCDAP